MQMVQVLQGHTYEFTDAELKQVVVMYYRGTISTEIYMEPWVRLGLQHAAVLYRWLRTDTYLPIIVLEAP